MSKVAKLALPILAGIILIAFAGVSFLFSQRDELIQKFAAQAAQFATEALGIKVEIGFVKVGDLNTDSVSDITISDLAIYDKNSKLIAKAESADIDFRLFTLASDPLSAIDKIKVNNVEANITKRKDGTWNVNDIQSTNNGESNFNAEIIISDINLNAKFDDSELNIQSPNLNLDFDTTAKFKANLKEAKISGEAVGNDIDIEKINTEMSFDHSNISINLDGTNIAADIAIDQLLGNDEQANKSGEDELFPALVMSAQVEKKSIKVDNMRATVDIDSNMNIKANAKAQTLGSNVQATAKINENKQIIDIAADRLDLDNVLPLIPEGLIPSGVNILGGIVNVAKINIVKDKDDLTFNGSANVQDGSVMVEQTQIDYINGTASFNEHEVIIDANAEANGQRAAASGKILIDDGEIFFDLDASSDSFNPNAVMYLPAEGTASFTAHLSGTPSNPVVDADIYSPYITYENFNAANVSTHMKYQDNGVYLTNLKASTFGGRISGDLELQAMDLSYNAHLKAEAINVNYLTDFLPALANISGRISGDVGINGVSDDLDKLKIYGTASAYNVVYENTPINRMDTSFIVEGDDIKIDFASAELPNRGSLGIEGTITDGNKLDLKFYGAHVDLTAGNNFISIPNADLSGLADFEGSVHGDSVNPDVELKFSAVDNSKREGEHFKGLLFNQPYDSLKFTASGSLDGITLQSFDMTKDGKDVWLAKGKVGLAGEKNIDLRVDTVGVRAETIMKLVAPDQPLTGNVDNVITVTGTLDKPNVVGYIELKRGSYRGMLVNEIAGDYYVEGDIIRVQDLHVNTPMVDMDLNGTINAVTTAMDFNVDVYDIDVKRFQSKLPENYPASGHGKFTGKISGDLTGPVFDGTLTAQSLSFNEVDISDVNGHVQLNGNDIFLENFSFKQGEGDYKVHGKINYATNSMSGRSELNNAGIAELLALANFKTDVIGGTLNSNIQFGGTTQNPSIQLVGTISNGNVAGYDVHDVNLNVNVLNNVVYLNTFEGLQGESGKLTASGTVDLTGPLDVKLSASNLSLAMFTKAAGLTADVIGTVNAEAIIGGYVYNPSAEVELTATGGVNGTTFDLLKGSLKLANGIVNVDELSVQKAIAEKIYQVSAKGSIPLVSLSTDKSRQLKSEEQINLDISLDNADLSLLPKLSEQYIAWAVGEMAGNLKITGTASNPLINGSIDVVEGTTKIKGMKSPIEHMNMKLAFTGKRMDVETFTGNIGNGKYTLTGGLQMNGLDIGNYNFNFVGDHLGIKSDFFTGPLNFDFTLSEEKTWRDEYLPKISGHIDFDNCLISIPTLPDDESTMPPILMDVSVNLGNKVHFYSSYLFDLYLTGNANFAGTTEHPRPSGSFTVKRGGTVSYLKTVFDVREGELHFNQMDTFMPSINFAADTKVAKTKVFLSAGGSLNDRTIKLTSSPEMSETEIMQLLTLRDAYQKGGDNDIETQDILLLGLQMSFLSEIENAVRKTIGLDQFSISRGSGSAFDNKTEMRDRHEEEYNVSIGKYITDNVMMKYTRGIGGDNINRYGFQYDFNDNISATVEREGHSNIFGFEARWKF